MVRYNYGKHRLSRVPVCCLVLSGLLAACAGLEGNRDSAGPKTTPATEDGPRRDLPVYDEKAYPLPADLRFVPAPVPPLRIAPGVGTVMGDPLPEAERRLLEGSFKTGYAEARLRDTPLAGVLGGDLVHRWPPEKPAAWVQNWRSSEPRPNSWGLPFLILGLRGLERDRVFTLTGPILDAYGRGEGLNGANGAAGYGAPRGDPFPHGGGFAQRFDRGLFTVDPSEKTAFIPGDPPAAALPYPPLTGSFPGATPAEAERIGAAFRSALRMAVDNRYPDPGSPEGETAASSGAEGAVPPKPDGEVLYRGFSPPLELGEEGESVPVRGLYIQLYEKASVVFLLADSPALPPHVRALRSPFLDALLASPRTRLPGAEALDGGFAAAFGEALAPGEAGEGWFAALFRGLSLYGIPLTDELPRYEAGLYRRAQRFSRGWMIRE